MDRALIGTGRNEAIRKMEAFAPKDVLNIDETGLFFRMLPDRSLSNVEYTKGTKKAKDRIIVA